MKKVVAFKFLPITRVKAMNPTGKIWNPHDTKCMKDFSDRELSGLRDVVVSECGNVTYFRPGGVRFVADKKTLWSVPR